MDIVPSFLDFSINHNKFSTNLNEEFKFYWLNIIKSKFNKRRFIENQVLFNANDNFTNLYFVDKGCLKTFKTSSSGVESISGFQMAGDWVGLENVGCKIHNNYAQTLVQSDIYVVNYHIFQKILLSSLDSLKKFNKLLSNEIIRNIRLLNILRNSKRENKVIHFFLDLSRKNSIEVPDKIVLNLPMSRGDISSYLSISREEISRILQKLQNDGLIDVKNRKIYLHDLPRLSSISSD